MSALDPDRHRRDAVPGPDPSLRGYLGRDLDWADPSRFRFAINRRAERLILTRPRAASAAECAALAGLYDRYIHLARDQRGSHTNRPVLWGSCIRRAATAAERGLLAEVKRRVLDALAGFYPFDDLVYALTALLRMSPGDRHAEHADNADYVCGAHGDHAWRDGDCRDGRWQPLAGSWWRDVSALVYLNDGFTGGRVEFAQYDREVTPQTGLLLAFPSNRRFLHAVTPVQGGPRYALALWLTRDQERREPM